MSSSATAGEASEAAPSGGRGAFLLRAFHSLTGVVPTGMFMLVELWTHAKALHGPDAHQAALERLAGSPALLVVAGLPMAFHAVYGAYLALTTRYTIGRYPTSANWNYTLQRVTGLLAFAFIAFHLATFWWPLRSGAVGPGRAFDLLSGRLSSTAMGVPWVGLTYALGLSACIFHFANGLRSFAVRWGLATTAQARTRAGAVSALLGALLFAAAAPVIVFFATGARWIGEPVNADASPPVCAAPQTSAAASATASASAAPLPSATPSATPSAGAAPTAEAPR